MNRKKKGLVSSAQEPLQAFAAQSLVLSFLHNNTIPFHKLMLSFMLLPDFRTIVENDHFSATIMVIPSRTSIILVVIFLIQAMALVILGPILEIAITLVVLIEITTFLAILMVVKLARSVILLNMKQLIATKQ